MSVAPKEHSVQFTEYWDARSGITLGIKRILFATQSRYQSVEVWETDAFGRMMTLDGKVMLTDRDEFTYHEMLVHPALAAHPGVRRVLVIGGGDGGTAREVLRYATVERVDVVDIDPVVTAAARAHFPELASSFDDPRATVHAEDGAEFVRQVPEGSYDAVLVDSTDPVGPAAVLFSPEFLEAAAATLARDGVFVMQAESPFDAAFAATVRNTRGALQRLFRHVERYVAFVPTYPMGLWSFLIATRTRHPRTGFARDEAQARIAPFAASLRYYDVDVHDAAFALPRFARDD